MSDAIGHWPELARPRNEEVGALQFPARVVIGAA